MSSATTSLTVKDAEGQVRKLAMDADSIYGLVPIHKISGSLATTAEISNFPEVTSVTSSNEEPLIVSNEFSTDVSNLVKSSYAWNLNHSGTFKLADLDQTRKELIIHNSSPSHLYIKVSSTSQSDSTKHGFSLINTSSAPSDYSFILYTSGTYITSDPGRSLYYGGYFISGSNTGSVFVTNIK